MHVSNGETSAELLTFSVKLTVPRQRRTGKVSFEFKPDVKDPEIQIPPDKDVVFHVTAEGFREWRESAGSGKVIHVPSGTHVALDVRLEPLTVTNYDES